MSAEQPTCQDPFEILASDYLERRRKGETPTLDEYVARFPDLEAEIRDLFPTIAALEDAKVSMDGPGGGVVRQSSTPPDRFGDFRLVREIGRGGMGVVYEAIQESLGRRVAIKVLPSRGGDPEQIARFRREAQSAGQLHHTNIVPVLGTGEADGHPYIVMPFVEGLGMDEAISMLADGPEAPGGAQGEALALLRGRDEADGYRRIARVVADVAGALAHAHERGVIHRDVKPGNILLATDGVARLADFGLACWFDGSEKLTRTGDVVGTLRYLSPERFRGEVGPGTDVYGLGVTLYEALTREPMFGAVDQNELLRLVVHSEPPPPRDLRPEIPRDLETITLRAIAREPARRYPSAAALAEDLESWLAGRPIRARRVLPFERLWLWCRRHPAEAGLSSLVAALLLAVTLVSAWGRREAEDAQHDAEVALEREKFQLEQSERHLARAQATTRIAVEALDRVFGRYTSGPSAGSDDSLAGGQGLPAQPILSEDSARMLEELLPLYASLAEQGESDDPALRKKASQALVQIGWIRSRLGQVELARQAYETAIERWTAARAGTPDEVEERAFALAGALNGLGQVLRSQGDAAGAEARYRAALEALRAASSSRPSTALLREEAATILLSLEAQDPGGGGATPQERPERPPGDEAALEREAERIEAVFEVLARALEASPGDPAARFLLARAHRERSALHGRGGSRGGREEIEEAFRILEDLAREHPSVVEYRYELARTLCRVPHERRLPEHEREDLEKQVRRAVEILEDLAAENPQEVGLAADLAHALHLLADLQERSDRGDAERTHRRAVNVQSYLLERMPDSIPTALWLATYRERYANLLLHRGERDEAERQARENLELLEPLLPKNPELVGTALQRANEFLERLPPPRR